jgi:hypothetical protein
MRTFEQRTAQERAFRLGIGPRATTGAGAWIVNGGGGSGGGSASGAQYEVQLSDGAGGFTASPNFVFNPASRTIRLLGTDIMPAAPNIGTGAIYAGANGDLYGYDHAVGAWVKWGSGGSGGVATVAGTANQIVVTPTTGNVIVSLPTAVTTGEFISSSNSSATAFQSGGGNFTADGLGNVSGAGVATFHGGFNCTVATSFDSIQTTGGIHVKHPYYGLTSEGPLWIASSNPSNPSNPDSSHVGYGALFHKYAGEWWYFDPDVTGSWQIVDFQIANLPVIAGLGVHVDYSTGPAKVSIGQAVETNSNVVFNQIVSAATGAALAFQGGGGNFQVLADGSIHCVTVSASGGIGCASLTATGLVNAQGVNCTNLYNSNSIQTDGGIYIKHASYGLTSDGPLFTKSALSPPTPQGAAINYGGLLHKQGSFWSVFNPELGIWFPADFQALAFAITSVVAGLGVHVSMNAGAATVSIGQAVETTSNVTFGNVTGALFNSSVTGAALAFQAGSGLFQASASGAVNCVTLTASGAIGCASLTASGLVNAQGVNCTHLLNYDSIQTEGGIHIKHPTYGLTSEGPLWIASSNPSNPANPDSSHVGYGALFHKYASQWWYFDPDISGSWQFVDFQTSGGTPGGANTNVQYNDSGISFGGSSNFTYNPTTQVVTVTGKTGTAAIAVGMGFVQSNQGFYTPSTAYNSIQTAGGVHVGSGMYLGSISVSQAQVAGGAYYSSSWFSTSPNPNVLNLANGTLAFYADTGQAGTPSAPAAYSPTQRFAINYNGTVGIGPAFPPAYFLHVNNYAYGQPTLNYHSAEAMFGLDVPGNMEMVMGWNNGIASNYGWWMQVRSAANASNSLTLQPAGGNVGIGTLAPTSPLTIIPKVQPTNMATTNQLVIGEPSDNSQWRLSLGYNSNLPAGVIQVTANASGYPLLLNPLGGSVGVNTSNPGAPLHVYMGPNQNAKFLSWGGNTSSLLAHNDAGNAYTLMLYGADPHHFISAGAICMRLQGTIGGGTNNTQLRFMGSLAATDLWAVGTDLSTGNGTPNLEFYDMAVGPILVLQKTTGVVFVTHALASASATSGLANISAGWGAIRHNSGSQWNYWDPVYMGGSWRIVDFATAGSGGASGVASLIGGTGVHVNTPTGSVTVSIGQPVETTSAVTFASAIATIFNSSAPLTLTDIAFQSGNGAFTVSGAGNIKGQDLTLTQSISVGNYVTASVYEIGGVVVIDSGRAVVNCSFDLRNGAVVIRSGGPTTTIIDSSGSCNFPGTNNNIGSGGSTNTFLGITYLNTSYASAFYATQYYRRNSNTVLVDANGVYYAYGSIGGIGSGPGAGTANWSGFTGFVDAFDGNPSGPWRLMRFLNGILIGIQ